MKKYIFVLSLMGLIASNAKAQKPVEVVKKFGAAMQQWCNTDEIEYHEQAMKLASGKIKCLVDDRITQDAVANDQSQLLTNGTQEIVSYLNIFQDAIMQGQKYDMSNVKARPDFVEPTAFKKNETPPSFVSADLALSGKLVYNVTDIFYVREGKITKIIDYSSDNSLGKALELYSNRKYDEAFKMFRKLAYADYGNFDAQYYMAVMEIKRQGCSFLDTKVRDKEATWFIVKNYFAHNQDAVNLATKFPLNEKQMDYAHFAKLYEWTVRCKQPAQSGLMMSFDDKTLTCGYVNERGKLIVPHRYITAYPFHDGRALVISKETKQCGFIDEVGNEAVPMIYQNAICDFYKGRTYCVKDKAAYLVDNQGKVLKVLQGYNYLNTIQPVGKYAMLFKTEKIFDIYDYNGNLCYQDYTDWNFNSITGLVTMKKSGSDDVLYKIEW